VTQLPLHIKGLEGVTVEPLPPDKPKRAKVKARPRVDAPLLPLSWDPARVDCKGKPGICLTLNCKWQLISEVQINEETRQASLHVFASPGRESYTLPQHHSSQRNVTWEDAEECSKAVVARAEYLHELVGTTCSRDLNGLTMAQVAQLLGLTRQAVQQAEAKAMKKLKHSTRVDENGNRVPWARAILGEYAEEPSAAGFVPLMRVGRRS
jgi:hypothetical protein